MNFLAHLYLAGNNHEIIIGNYIADSVKGKSINNYSPLIIKGIQMHRAIDSYTDSNEVIKKSINFLRPDFEKYSGVVLDVYLDHFLARNWDYFSNIKLEQFSANCYNILSINKDIFPKRSKDLLNYLIKHDRLTTYRDYEGLNSSLSSMALRTKFESNMENATSFLIKNYEFFFNQFILFFPNLISFTENYKTKNNIN